MSRASSLVVRLASRSRHDSAAAALTDDLRRALGKDRVLTRDVDRRTYSYDAYLDEALPEAIVFPASTEDVRRIVAIARHHGVPLLPRGCGTNLSGGTVPIAGGLVVELSRMDRVLTFDVQQRLVRVEPGVYNTDVSAAVDAQGFFYAPDPASGKACSIGGNVAEGSGGPHCFKYGVTANHVLGLTVVLPTGEVVRLGGDVPDLPGYDLVGVFIGSEGTLGVCTEATLAVLPKPEAVRTMLAVYDSIETAGETVSAIIAAGIVPATLEMMDNLVIQAVEDSFAAGFPRDAAAVLLIEVDGFKEGVEQQSGEVTRLCESMGATEVRVARDEAEREALWKGRKGAFGAISRLAPNYLVADGTVPRARLPETLRRVLEIAAEHDLRVGNVFHAGDGNLHPLILFDSRDEEQKARVLRASMEMLAVCVEMGGTITGEHGIGTEKLDAMGLVFTEADLRLQRLVKRCFDPEGICNPGKLLPDQASAAGRAPAAAGAGAPAGAGAGAAVYADAGVRAVPRAAPGPAARIGSAGDVREALLAAAEDGRVVVPHGGGTRATWGAPVPEGSIGLPLSGLDAVLECDPGNLVMHVQAGMSVSAARAAAREAGLLLPLDAGLPDAASIGGSIACNEQGPRRARFGSVRDVVLGVGVVLPSGDYVRAGGQTMKNVAGLNLTRLFVGSLGTLGVVVDAWVRLLPGPQAESFVAVPVTGAEDAAVVMRAVADAHLAPDMAELVPASCLAGACPPPSATQVEHDRTMLFAFAGDGGSVARQVGDLLRLAGGAGALRAPRVLEPGGGGQALVDRVASFGHAARAAGYDVLARAQVPVHETAAYVVATEAFAAASRLSLVSAAGLASGIVHLAVKGDAATLAELIPRARARAEELGGALILCAGWEALADGFDGWGRRDPQVMLMRRLKAAVDTRGILNPGRYVGGI